MFNKFELLNDDGWLALWLIPSNGSADVIYRDYTGNAKTWHYDSYDEAARSLIRKLIDFQMLGYRYVTS